MRARRTVETTDRTWSANGRIGTTKNGPDSGVRTSGRGLIDATKERQL